MKAAVLKAFRLGWPSGLTFGAVVMAVLACATAASADPRIPNISVTNFPVERSTTQAGGHPNTKLIFEFCDQGVPILSATNTAPIRITTAEPLVIAGSSYVRGAEGNTAANGQWAAQSVGGSTTQFDLIGSNGTHSDPYVPSSGRLRSTVDTPKPTWLGCSATQIGANVRDFTLKLPPGLLGNPTALQACPEQVWVSIACPPESIVGYSWTSVHQSISRDTIITVPSPVYNVTTFGLEPARLGTTIFPSDPAGPFPITIGIRTSGDRGIDSTLINIPRNLGGFGGTPIEITTSLCGRVPTCTAQQDSRNDPTLNSADYDHSATTYPFFTNPTSCGTKDVGLTARSWRSPSAPTAATVQPAGTNPPGAVQKTG